MYSRANKIVGPLDQGPDARAFPLLTNDNVFRAIYGEEILRIPVWLMRQAGRYLPEYQAIRRKHDFFTICKTPELACEVTMQPLRRFDLDAAIIFSDILVVPQALGLTVEMVPGKGPVFPNPLKSPNDICNLNFNGVAERLSYVADAIRHTRYQIKGTVPLIGFSCAPWTLMGYMIEGGGSKTMCKAKYWLSKHNTESHTLLSQLTDAIIDYLEMQVKAGAQLLQIFESSADYIDRNTFLEVSIPYVRRICVELRKRLEDQSIELVPMILFAKGAGHSLREQSECGYEVISIDHNVDPIEAREQLGPNITIQGNLDPNHLYKPSDELSPLVEEMVRKFGKNRYIANLGHGVTPKTPIDGVDTFSYMVHRVSADLDNEEYPIEEYQKH